MNNEHLLKILSSPILKFEKQSFPRVLYRDFSTRSDAENFLAGNIWFAGISQNRHVNPNEGGEIKPSIVISAR